MTTGNVSLIEVDDSEQEENIQVFGGIRVKPWPEDAVIKDGFSLKSRNSDFKGVLDKFDTLFAKGVKLKMNSMKLRVLDKRNIPYGVEIEVDAVKDSLSGVILLKIFNKSKKREATVTVSKSKQSQHQIVEKAAKEAILPTLTKMLQEMGTEVSSADSNEKKDSFSCKVCGKIFMTLRNMRIHASRTHKKETDNDLKMEIDLTSPASDRLGNKRSCHFKKTKGVD